MRVPMLGIGAEKFVVAMKLVNASGAKGLCYSVLEVSQLIFFFRRNSWIKQNRMKYPNMI